MQNFLDRATTTDLMEGLRTGEFSSRELLDAQLDRIDIFNPSVNAVVAFDAERAMERASAADDRRSAAGAEGPADSNDVLAGLSMTVKDCYEVEGVTTTAGSPTLADHVSDSDADLVTALREAGAIIYGKTNVPLFAGDHQTYNDVYGVTRNPWDPERTPGGSSGGSAASVACGFSTAEIGSDIGGSIRVPSHYCGVFGFNPTHGVLSSRGHVPGPPGTLSPDDLAVCGPLGRSVEDLQLLFEVLGRVSPFGGVPGAALPAAPDEPVSLGDLRVGVWADDSLAPVAEGVGRVVDEFASALGGAGASVDRSIRPSVSSAQLHETYLRLLSPVMLAGLPPELFASMAEAPDPVDEPLAARMGYFGTRPHRDWLGANEQRYRAIAAWDEVFRDVDVMVAPVSQTPAIPHTTDESYGDRTVRVDDIDRPYPEILFWAGLAIMASLPVVTLPAGSVDGLPCGVQIMGPRWSDNRLLAIAAAMSAEMGIAFEAPTLIVG